MREFGIPALILYDITMKIRIKRPILLSIIVFLLSACVFPSGEKYIQVFFPDGDQVTAQLAQTDEDRQRGLMFRDKINRDQGMLFVFAREGTYGFWMKNVNFSLDILWLNADRRIVHIQAHVPPCDQPDCPTYTPDRQALYVLEIKAGEAERRRLKLFDRLEFILDE